MGCEISQVSVKARTMEGMGDIGKGEAIAVQSVVILE
jgi:2C-methyl-D-erythritol 2,4-cyclodiphosphate synthase